MNKPVTGFRFIGQPMPRNEDARLVVGQGRFTDDFDFPSQTYAAMVRSPHPHARIVSIDKSRAQALPGVLGVFTGADCAADGLRPIGHDPLPKTRDDMKLTGPGGSNVFIGPHLLLPADKVRHVGEAVAMVVADTKAQALDAAEALVVVYEELPFVLQSEDAMKAGAPAVWDEVPNNILVDTHFGDATATDRAFALGRECRRHGFYYRPRHRRSARSCAPASPITMRPAAAIRYTPAAAAPCGRKTSWPAFSASSPTPCACCRSTSAAISVPATASIRNTAWCCGRRASSAAR